MQRILELIIAGAIGAAVPTIAGLYFAKAPEVYVEPTEISMCGDRANNACFIQFSGKMPVELPCGDPVDLFSRPCRVEIEP